MSIGVRGATKLEKSDSVAWALRNSRRSWDKRRGYCFYINRGSPEWLHIRELAYREGDRMTRTRRATLLALIVSSLVSASTAFAQTYMCPDGSYVSSPPCTLCPNGRYVGGSSQCTITPGGQYVPGPGPAQMAPDGSWHPGGSRMVLCPDGSYVTGNVCVLTPNGHYVGG